jgi:flagellar motor switch protein FliM
MTRKATPDAAQRTAVHCDALLKRPAAPQDVALELERFCARLAGALRPVLSAREVRPLGGRPLPAGKLAEHCGPIAANSVHMLGKSEVTALLSLDARALLAQLDRAFGGAGEVQGRLPAELPLSADLLAKRLEQQTLKAVAGELGAIEVRSGRRATSVTELAPFDAATALTMIEFEVEPDAGAVWTLSLAIEAEALAALLPQRASAARAKPAEERKRGANSAPFADLPLIASATLVDMPIPLHRLASLAPGDVLPIMVARNVPLQIGEAVIARGTVGEVDKQVALQITQTSLGKDIQ